MSDRPPPPDAIRVVPNVPRLSHDDVADEYAVHFDDALPGGCMVWARYDERWVCNPWSTRALTRTLLARHAAEVERVRGVEAERDEARADRDAIAAGLDAISDILDGMMEGASREETKEALYVAAMQAWNAAARGTFRPNEWWRPFADAHIARCGANGVARARADGVREGREEAAESDRLLVAIEEWTHDAGSQYVPTGGDADTFGDGVRRAQSRVRNILNTRRLPSPAAPPVAGPDTDLVEREAERIYNGWREKAGFKPWVPGGNSDAQDHARGLARAALLRTGGAS